MPTAAPAATATISHLSALSGTSRKKSATAGTYMVKASKTTETPNQTTVHFAHSLTATAQYNPATISAANRTDRFSGSSRATNQTASPVTPMGTPVQKT